MLTSRVAEPLYRKAILLPLIQPEVTGRASEKAASTLRKVMFLVTFGSACVLYEEH
jgi:hypothetical protein